MRRDHSAGGVIRRAIISFQFDVGRLPIDLKELFEAPKSVVESKRWQGPYLEARDALIDAQERPYRYIIYQSVDGGRSRFRICSDGPDGIRGTADDLCN